MKHLSIILLSATILSSCNYSADNKSLDLSKGDMQVVTIESLNSEEKLGKLLFFETVLSEPPGQSCATCHDPAFAFSNPLSELPVSKGALAGTYGNRNDMPVSYSMYVHPLYFDKEEGVWEGGLFWDGRANTLAEQAMGPPLNPLEMANTDTVSIAEKLRALDYADLFYEIYGDDALSDPGRAFKNMVEAMVAYEKSEEVNPFNSKYDYYLKGEVQLTDQEMRGLSLFVAENKGNCSACHPNTPSEEKGPVLFTDFTYDNLGVPKNPENPFYLLPPEYNPEGINFIDLGLGATLNDPSQNGKFRVPTLRNVAITSPYMHNGLFKTLYQVIAFYNTRDLLDWPPPEVAENVNIDEMGNLGLSNMEVEDLVAFLNTLTDNWKGD